MNVGEFNDKELFLKFQEGDSSAFAVLYDRYWPALWRFASNSISDEDHAKDIVQDVFVAIWNKRNELSCQPSLQAYLYRATLNRIINSYHKEKTASCYLQYLKTGFQEGDFTTDQFIHEKELRHKFETALHEMPSKMRAIFEYSRLENMTHQEISDELKISRENVKRQIKNALIIMKRRILSIL